MNHQQTFNGVVDFAYKQNSKSIASNNRSCFYRENHQEVSTKTHIGRMCFIGAFIPDNLYYDGMENKDAEDLFNSIPTLFDNHFAISDLSEEKAIKFWMDMQQIHDKQDVNDWERAFRTYANEQGLTYASTR